MRLFTALDELADAGDPGRSQQLPKLGQLVRVWIGKRCDQKRALARTALRSLPVARRLLTSVAGSLHRFMVAGGLAASDRAVTPAGAPRSCRYWK